MYALVPQVTLLVLVKLFLLSHSCVDCIISLSSLLLEEKRVEVGIFFLRLFFKYSLTFDLHISFIIYSYKRQFNVSPTFSYWVSLHYFGVCHMFNRPGQNICIFDYC